MVAILPFEARRPTSGARNISVSHAWARFERRNALVPERHLLLGKISFPDWQRAFPPDGSPR
jgi:hypothetical protein